MSSDQEKSRVRSLLQGQRLDDALAQLLAMYEQDTQDVEVWHLLATVNGLLGRFDTAEKWSRQVISACPGLAEAWINLAAALQYSGKHEPALDAYEHVLELEPENVQARLAAADLYRKLDDPAAALHSYREAVRLRPQTGVLHYNLGTFLQETGDYAQAEECYLTALDLEPGLVQAHNNLGLICQEQCRLNEAMQHFDAALKQGECAGGRDQSRDAAIAEVHRHRALLWLLQGDFARGWPEYEWRHTDPVAIRRSFSSPEWDGSSLSGRTILVGTEQGIGDEIMFASCIRDIQSVAGQVILECNPRLVTLFSRSFPGVHVRGVIRSGAAPLPGAVDNEDVHVYIGNLPRHCRRRLAEFPRRAYLDADPEKVRMWQERYRDAGDGIKVGVSWRGGGIPRIRRKRSTTLQQWLNLFRLQGVQFINLQYGDCTDELLELSGKHGVTVWHWPDADPLQDLDDFAAKVAGLDMVISVDNATVHMAGALGLPVWLLQPYSPEWRWLLDREDSCWYPNLRQFRQPSIDDWESVFDALRRALLNRVRVLGKT